MLIAILNTTEFVKMKDSVDLYEVNFFDLFKVEQQLVAPKCSKKQLFRKIS